MTEAHSFRSQVGDRIRIRLLIRTIE